jgi:amino acid transporter
MTQQSPSLRRELKLRHFFTLSFGTIIGVGWITVLGSWLSEAGPVGAMLAFLAGGLLLSLIGMCYSEVATMYPVSGGEVAYAYAIDGAWAAFGAGWFLAFSYITTVGFEAISVGWILETLFPAIGGPVLYSVLGEDVKLGGLLVGLIGTAIICWVNYRGAGSMARFQDTMTYGLLFLSGIFIVAGILFGDTANLEPWFVRRETGWPWMGVVAVLATTPFYLLGFDVIPQAMGEKSEGAALHLMNRVIVLGLVGAGIFYALVILAASMSLPRAALLAHELPAVGALEAALGSPQLGRLVLFAGLLGLITTWNACFFAGSRVLYALGRASIIPTSYGEVHPRHRSPKRAVLLVGLAGAVAPFLGRGAILPMVDASTVAIAGVFLLICVGVMRLRRARPDHPRPYRVPGGNAIPIAAALASAGILFLALYTPYLETTGRLPVAWGFLFVWCGLGVAFWRSASKIRNQVDEETRRTQILTAGD